MKKSYFFSLEMQKNTVTERSHAEFVQLISLISVQFDGGRRRPSHGRYAIRSSLPGRKL